MRWLPILAVLVLAGCTQGAGHTDATTTVVIQGSAYHPAEVTVKNGTLLRFENRDDYVHAPTNGEWTLNTPAGTTSSVSVDRVGDFEVPCAYHGITVPLKLHVVA